MPIVKCPKCGVWEDSKIEMQNVCQLFKVVGSTLPFPPDYEHFYSVTKRQQQLHGSGGGTVGGIIGSPIGEGLIGEDGLTPVLGRSPSFKIQSRTVYVDILRCRHCETPIGEKDYGLSEEEIKLYALEEKKAKEEAGSWSSLLDDLLVLIVLIVIVVGWILFRVTFSGLD